MQNTDKTTVKQSRFELLLRELKRKSRGRDYELHFAPANSLPWSKNSVYVRGNEHDGYVSCVAYGHGAKMETAIRKAIEQLNRNPLTP